MKKKMSYNIRYFNCKLVSVAIIKKYNFKNFVIEITSTEFGNNIYCLLKSLVFKYKTLRFF